MYKISEFIMFIFYHSILCGCVYHIIPCWTLVCYTLPQYQWAVHAGGGGGLTKSAN
jgi:hypothetical protein